MGVLAVCISAVISPPASVSSKRTTTDFVIAFLIAFSTGSSSFAQLATALMIVA